MIVLCNVPGYSLLCPVRCLWGIWESQNFWTGSSQWAQWAWVTNHLQCTIQTIPFWDFMDGMNLCPMGQFIWSVVFFFLLGLLFCLRLFFVLVGSSLFFFLGSFRFNFFLAILTTIVFCGNSYLPLQCTYHPSSYQPIYLPHSAHPSFVLVLSTITNAWDLVGQSFRRVRRNKGRIGAPKWEDLGASVKKIELQGKFPSSLLCFF